MGIVLRQSIKGSIAQYFGVLIGYVNLLYVIPYCLSPEENGLFRLLIETASFFALFAQIGIPNAIPRFGPEFRAYGKEKKLERFALTAPIISILVFILIYAVFFRSAFNHEITKQSSLFTPYEWVLIPLGIFIVYSNILENLIANHYRITITKLAREVLLRAGLASSCMAYAYFGFALSNFFSLIGLTYFLIGAILFIYFLKVRKSNEIKHSEKVVPRSTYASLARFLSLIVISGIGTNLVNKLDIFMVSSQIGLTDNAIYSTAFLITMVIEVPSRSFQQIMAPIISEAIFNSNKRKISWAYKKSSVGQSFMAIFILTLIVLNANWIYNTMPNGDLYKLGLPLILLLGIAKIFDAFTGINGLILANSKHYYVGIYFTIALALIAIWLNNLLIPNYQLMGVAVATAISIFLYNLIMSIYVWYKFRIHPFSNSSWHIGWYILIAVLAIFTGKYLEQSLFAAMALSILFSLISIFYLAKFPVIREARLIINRVIKFK